MLNEWQEFLDYTETVSYTAKSKNDTSYMGRFTFTTILEFKGLTRVLTIIARRYMFHDADGNILEGDPRKRLDHVRKALCAWCSVPDSKKAAPKRERPDKSHFEELHEIFPELVDADGSGWFHRHVHCLARFVLDNPDKVRKTVIPKAEVIEKSFDAAWRNKTVREDKNSTGKNTGSLTDIKDGYAHTATASVGDTVDYQIISTMPTITSKASDLSEYAYVDTMSKGIKYNKNDVAIEFFKDSGCTDKITTWAEDSGKFTVAYDDAQNIMTIRMTEAGLSEINEAATVYTDSVKRGYSDCTMRITYAATLTADAATYGDRDNPNRVKLTWKRTNTTYYDTLEDCCHVYVYAIDLIKQFGDNNGTFGKVKFIAYNDTDGYYIKANMEGEVYNVTGFTSNKSEATMLIPNLKGHIILRGIEDDTYTLTEVATDKGYVLLRDPVKIMVITKEDGACERCGAALLTASATVNGEPVSMTDANAVVPLRIINNPGFDLPKTGGYGVWMYTVGGVLLLGAAAFIVVKSRRHKSEQ